MLAVFGLEILLKCDDLFVNKERNSSLPYKSYAAPELIVKLTETLHPQNLHSQ